MDAIRAAKVPARVSASWLDGTTADSALLRYVSAPEVPMEIVIGATTHPGGLDADPFSTTPFEDARPNAAAQFQADVNFAKRVVAGEAIGRSIKYVVLGSDVWKSTSVWPPAGITSIRNHLGTGNLATEAPLSAKLEYVVDPDSTLGPLDRWASQRGSPIFYGDLRKAPGQRLEFTTAPVERDLELIGTPELCLTLQTDQPDGTVIAYLEDVAPDGRVTYLTEGEIRLLHRKTTGEPCDPAPGTLRSFARADSAAIVAGEVNRVEVPFLSTAALIKTGHSVRLALAGADKLTFPMLTGDHFASWSVNVGGSTGSALLLPLRPWSAD
jgi:putative CocE/NonD family hydrolase